MHAMVLGRCGGGGGGGAHYCTHKAHGFARCAA